MEYSFLFTSGEVLRQKQNFDETPMIVDKAQELLDVFILLWGRQIGHHPCFD